MQTPTTTELAKKFHFYLFFNINLKMNINQRYKTKETQFSLRWAKSETMIKYIMMNIVNQRKIFAGNSV